MGANAEESVTLPPEHAAKALATNLQAATAEFPFGRRLVSTCVSAVPLTGCSVQVGNYSYNDRGMCVITEVDGMVAGYECWDICDFLKPPSAYKIVPSDGYEDLDATENNTNAQLAVQSIRHGKNMRVNCCQENIAGRKCPEARGLDVADWCPLGRRCGSNGGGGAGIVGSSGARGATNGTTAFAEMIPENRGLCVADPAGPYGRACWDMCNWGVSPERYSLGTQSTTIEGIVNSVRAGTDTSVGCPGHVYWPWVCGVSVLVCLLFAVCAFCVRAVARSGKLNGLDIRAMATPRADSARTPGIDSARRTPGIQNPVPEEAAERGLAQSDRLPTPPPTPPMPPAPPAPVAPPTPPAPSAPHVPQTIAEHVPSARPSDRPSERPYTEELTSQSNIRGLDQPNLFSGVQQLRAPDAQTWSQLGMTNTSFGSYRTTPLLSQPAAKPPQYTFTPQAQISARPGLQ